VVARRAGNPQGSRHLLLPKLATLVLLALALTCAPADTVSGAAQPTQWIRAKIHGHRIYYAVRGSGQTLVFLHGGGDFRASAGRVF
jgi:hypothetical protein